MLLILCGTSGSGRSMAVCRMIADHGWRSLPWLTTRSARPGDVDRKYASDTQFDEADLYYEFDFDGHRYGVLNADLRVAVESSTVYATDVLPSSLHAFAALPCVVVGIELDDAELERRLLGAERGHRLERARHEQTLWRSVTVRRRFDATVRSDDDMASSLRALPLDRLLIARARRA